MGRHLGEGGYLLGLSSNGAGHALATWFSEWTSDAPHKAYVARFRPGPGWSEPQRVFRAFEYAEPLPWIDRHDVARLFHGGLRVRQAADGSWTAPRRVLPGRAWADTVTGNGWRVVLLYESVGEYWARVFTP